MWALAGIAGVAATVEGSTRVSCESLAEIPSRTVEDESTVLIDDLLESGVRRYGAFRFLVDAERVCGERSG